MRRLPDLQINVTRANDSLCVWCLRREGDAAEFDAASPFAFFHDADLNGDALVQFLPVRDDTDTPAVLPGDLLQAFEGRHDGIEAFLVERAESLVDKKDIDVHIGPVQR